MSTSSVYDEPAEPGLPPSGFQLDVTHAALVVTDPQNDFLSPDGATWSVFGASVEDNGTVEHIDQLLSAAKSAGITVAISPHYYYPSDQDWQFAGPLERFMHSVGMFARTHPLQLEGFDGSGADYLERYKNRILDGKTVVASPHKIVGPQSNDLILQLRKRGVTQVLLAGMAANLCTESHLRELIEQGFEVVVIRDATAGARLPEGDGYLAALINFRFLASAIWTTDQAVAELAQAT